MKGLPHLKSLEWNHQDELVRVKLDASGNVAHYTYDGGGQRTRKIITNNGLKKKERLYLGLVERYQEYDNNGVVTLERWTLQVEGLAQVDTLTVRHAIGLSSPTPVARYQYRDRLGSSTIEANELGQVISYEEYYPYGASAYRAAASGVDLSLKRYRFTGKERDEETGLDYFGVRYYASWLGRWTSADPGDFIDGLNLYRYTQNNPVNGVDNLGYETDPSSQNQDSKENKPPPEQPKSGFYFLSDGSYLGYIGNDKLTSAAEPHVYVIDETDYYAYGGGNVKDVYDFIYKHGLARFSMLSKQLENSEGTPMTIDQFIDRIHYNWGEGQSAPPLYYAHAMMNRGQVREGEDEIYSDRSRHKMIDGRENDESSEVNKNYLKFKKYKDNGFTFDETWDEEDKKRLKNMYSEHLKASAGITEDPFDGVGYWLGGWGYIDKARNRNTGAENVTVVLVYKGSDSSKYKDKLSKRSNYSVNIFYHYGQSASEGTLGKTNVFIYDKAGNLLEETSIKSGLKSSLWRRNKEEKIIKPDSSNQIIKLKKSDL